MLGNIAICIIGAAAAIYLARSLFTGRKKSPCAGCPASGSCPGKKKT